jgi:hypothetical protein
MNDVAAFAVMTADDDELDNVGAVVESRVTSFGVNEDEDDVVVDAEIGTIDEDN